MIPLSIPSSYFCIPFMLKIPSKEREALRRHGEETYPYECCGVLLGRAEDDGSRVVTSTARCGNTRTDSPETRYHIDPRELVRIQREGRERGEDIVGFYHSHPDHPARWSQTDLAEAHWFGCSYVITAWKRERRRSPTHLNSPAATRLISN
jgi:proteasome lid subunit RPN8/RPN11